MKVVFKCQAHEDGIYFKGGANEGAVHFKPVASCRTGIHAYRDWKTSSKFKLFISVLSVSVIGGSVVLHKTNTNKSNSTK